MKRLIFLSMLSGCCCLPLGDGSWSELSGAFSTVPERTTMPALPEPVARPSAHLFPNGDILVFEGSYPRQKVAWRLPAGANEWEKPVQMQLRKSLGERQAGGRLWVRTYEEGELGWLDSRARFHPVTLPELPEGVETFYDLAIHTDGAVSAWTRTYDNVFTVYHYDGARWQTLPASPGAWIEAGWGSPGGELVLLTYFTHPFIAPSNPQLQHWRDGEWKTYPLSANLRDRYVLQIVPGPERVLLFAGINAYTVNLDGSDFKVLDVPKEDYSTDWWFPGAAPLPDGRFVFVGGYTPMGHRPIGTIADTWIIERDGAVTAGPALSKSRAQASVLVLGERRVAVIGGNNRGETGYTDIEILKLPAAARANAE